MTCQKCEQNFMDEYNTNVINLICFSDSYKVSHYLQYPKGTTQVYSYFESRGGKFSETIFFGLQYIIKRYLAGQVITLKKIESAKEMMRKHFGRDLINEEGWRYILQVNFDVISSSETRWTLTYKD
uniref:Nicotinamide phosphoribosyltransferase n=1 Tax=Schistocephalus solidus TaxID=70667 RepID=A0A0V0J313_SCHSO